MYFQELRDSWQVGFLDSDVSDWKKFPGPLSALKLSLRRISWGTSDFVTLVNDSGEEVRLAVTSPSLLKYLLFRALLRTLGRQARDKAGMKCGRLCFDVIRSRLRSKKTTALGRGC